MSFRDLAKTIVVVLFALPSLALADAGRLSWDGDRSTLRPLEEVAEWRSPRVDVEKLKAEDEVNRDRKDIPRRIGFPMQVDLSPANSGSWEELPGGDRLWRLKVVSERALWTVLGFDVFRLQHGGAMSVQNASGKTIMGPYTATDIRKHGELWFPPIAEDTLIVELYWPRALRDVAPALHLATVSHGYKSWGVIDDGTGIGDDISTLGFGDSGSCNIDTACPEGVGWEDQTRSVVMVLAGGSGNCSGSMLNTTAQDCRPILLTAAHCGENGPSTTLGFNFVRPECNAGTPPPETNQTLTGGTLLGNWSSSDFTLIEMDEAPPEEFEVYFSGWSRDPAPALNTHVISHPRGDVKKIAFDADPPVDGSNWGTNHWRIDDSNPDPAHLAYEWGTTEPASSGSPLFDHNKRVIGQLHGGTASCSSDTYDEYGKLDASWTGGGTPATRAAEWLDPESTGALFVDGVDHPICLFQPAGSVLFTRDVYACSDTLVIALRDDNIPGIPTTVDVTVSSATESVPETVTLTQDQPGVGRFSGLILSSAAPPVHGDGLLSVSHLDSITVNYIDADDGQGGSNLTKKDTAEIDCAPPVITNVASGEVTGNSALITWDTDEPANSSVTHGESVPPGITAPLDGDLVTAHDLRLFGLAECSVHYYSVSSADLVGNGATDDNLSSYYTFETGRNVNPDYPSVDTPIAIPDSDATGITSSIAVADNKTVLDVDVALDITHTYDGDLTISLIPPVGAPIVLSNRRGGSGENFSGTVFDDEAATPIASGSPPFAGSFQPDQPLSAADGIIAAGTWSLKVVDGAGSDLGTLDNWTLVLTYPAQACGPHASYASHDAVADTCVAGGAGTDNGYWDAGEQVEFGIVVDNDGTDGLSGVTVEVTPQTPGAVMLEPVAAYPDIPEGDSAGSVAPNFAVKLPEGIGCGETVSFDVMIDANEGSWAGGFSQVVGEVVPGGGTALFEDFEGGLPATWSVVDGFADGNTWFLDNSSDPSGCSNTDPAAPIAGNWVTADSDCAGSGVQLDEELISPVIDLSAALSVTLEFDHWFRWYSGGQNETADVDVRSSLTAGAWVNVQRWQGADSGNPDHASIDLTAEAAGASDVQIRWHYYDAVFEWTWSVDNVALSYTAPGGCNMPVCLGAAGAPPPIPDGAPGTQPLRANRLNLGGSQIGLSWDDQCTPVNTNLLYGPLDQVASYGISGSRCGISNPQVWSMVPPGDLWFLLVSDDGSGHESSWGLATAGERNGLGDSGTCGSVAKDLSGSCP